jgi:NitT/TauT family transport system permease protein
VTAATLPVPPGAAPALAELTVAHGPSRAVRAARQVGIAVVLLALAVVGWELVKAVTGSNDRTMPHLWDILGYLGTKTSQGETYGLVLLRNTAVTARGALLGLLFGALLGVASGVLIARSRLVGNGLLPLIVAAQTVPIVAVSPALVLWLGTGWMTKVAIATYLTYFPVAVATARGVQAVPRDAIDLLHSYAAPRRTTLLQVELPFALPLVMVGLETAAAFSVVGTIVGELPFGSKEGLGVMILTSWQFYTIQPRALYCVALAACLLGGLLVVAIRGLGLLLAAGRPQGEVL